MIERIVIVDSVDPVCFYGVNNSNMTLIRNLFPKLRIAARGSVIKAIGEEGETADFERKIKELEAYAVKYNKLTEDVILDIVKGDAPKALKSDGVIIYGINGKPIAGRTPNQQLLVDTFSKNDLTFALGPAGTGKTYVAIALAVRALKNKEVRKIILSRPAVEAGEKLGFLPGDMKDKIDPYLQPLYDALEDMIPAVKLKEYLETNVIQIAPLAFMRGRTLNDAVIVLDEDVPHPHGRRLESGRYRRRHPDRPAALGQLRPYPGAEDSERGSGNRPCRVRQERHRAPRPRAAHRRGLRAVRQRTARAAQTRRNCRRWQVISP